MASFDNMERCDHCGTWEHERHLSYDDKALCLQCADAVEEEREAQGAQDFTARLADNGYQIRHTGGGCTAFEKWFGLCSVMITQDASHEIIPEYMSDIGLVIGVYPDELEGQHLFFVNPTHTNWDMIYGLVLQAENAAKALNAISAWQKVEE